MKKVCALMLSLCLAVSLCVPALAAGAGMSNFKPVKESGHAFSDVAKDHWAHRSIDLCYQYGLMNGTWGNRFNPAGELTVAEAIAMADRVHDIYTHGEETIQSGAPWYRPYVDYALQNGIIAAGVFAHFDAKATRSEMAYIFNNALPGGELPAINRVDKLPDVSFSTPYADAVFTLYNAGVLAGKDKYGTFAPDDPITRAEAAAILTRLAMPKERQKLTLMKSLTWKDLKFTVPQDAQAEWVEGGYTVHSVSTSTSVVVEQSKTDASLTTELVSKETAEGIFKDTMGMTKLKTQLVSFGETKVYRGVGIQTQGEVPEDWVVYLYFLKGKVTVVVFKAPQGGTVLKEMANSFRISGQWATPKL